jgi:hypothetical protein
MFIFGTKLNIMKTVKSIFEKEGYAYDKDGRNRTHRSLQKLLDSGFISFRVCEKGKVFVSKSDGTKYNVSVSIKIDEKNWRIFRYKCSCTNIDGYDVLKLIGITLQIPEVKEVIKSYVDIDATCQRCNGKGIIPAFHYYCDGICFECYGLGYNSHFKPIVEIIN